LSIGRIAMRASQAGEGGDLSRVVHADLDHAESGVERRAGQRQRQAPVVVVGGDGGMGRAEGGQDGTHHFLGGRLADAAGDRDHLALEAGAGEAAHAGQGCQRVIDQQGPVGAGYRAMHQGAGRALGHGIEHEVMAIAAFAHQGDEQVTRHQGAGVDGHAGRVEGAGDRAAGGLGQVDRGPERGHAVPFPSTRARTTLASSKGMTVSPMIWPCS
jgi:hypothetical protein